MEIMEIIVEYCWVKCPVFDNHRPIKDNDYSMIHHHINTGFFFTIKHSSWLFMYLHCHLHHLLEAPFTILAPCEKLQCLTPKKKRREIITPLCARSLWAETRLHKECIRGGFVVAIPSPFGDRKGCNCYTSYEKRVIFMGISWGYPWGYPWGILLTGNQNYWLDLWPWGIIWWSIMALWDLRVFNYDISGWKIIGNVWWMWWEILENIWNPCVIPSPKYQPTLKSGFVLDPSWGMGFDTAIYSHHNKAATKGEMEWSPSWGGKQNWLDLTIITGVCLLLLCYEDDDDDDDAAAGGGDGGGGDDGGANLLIMRCLKSSV